MSLFKVHEQGLINEFQDKFRNEMLFYDELIKENDWRYYNHVSKNLAVSEPVILNELGRKMQDAGLITKKRAPKRGDKS